MSRYEIPTSRHAAVRDAVRVLTGARRAILTTHVQADGDGLGSQIALLSLLEGLGGEGWIVNPTPIPRMLRFLVDEPERVLDPVSDEARARCREADLCVVVDTGERSRIGRVMPLVQHLPILVIDHHPTGNDPLPAADGSIRDAGASATGELVFDLLWEAGATLTAPAVDGLYVAILTDTGSFRFSNATSRVLRVASELVERGASPDRLYREIYGQIPMRRMRLLQEALPTLDTSADGLVAWLTVSADTFRDLGCSSEDLEGLVDYPRELEGVEVGLLFRELEDGQVKVSLRSNDYVDVNALARAVGGGGHVRAAGALVPGALDEVLARVVERAVAAATANGDREGSHPGRGGTAKEGGA